MRSLRKINEETQGVLSVEDEHENKHKPTCCNLSTKQTVLVSTILICALIVFLAVAITVSVLLANYWEVYILEDNVSVSRTLRTLSDLQDIANQHVMSRNDYSGGYNASVEYILSKLQNTNLHVYTQTFDFVFWQEHDDSMYLRVSSTGGTGTLQYDYYQDFRVCQYSPSGVISNAGVGAVANGGCLDSDWAGFTPGLVAVIPTTATCDYDTKLYMGEKYGASMIIDYNIQDSSVPLWCSLYKVHTTPYITVKTPIANMLTMFGPLAVINAEVETSDIPLTTCNVLAETVDGDVNNTVAIGAHLDAYRGSGINDNGSGSMALLELALAVDASDQSLWLKNKILFGWWAVEEQDKKGSKYFLSHLNETNLSIACYLNMDMIASPNYIIYVLNGSQLHTTDNYTHSGNIQLQNMFMDYYDSQNVPYVINRINGEWSDFSAFLSANTPTTSTETGAWDLKTVQTRALFGGLAGAPADPCYHTSCDTEDNISEDALSISLHSNAHVLQKLAENEGLREFLASGTPQTPHNPSFSFSSYEV
ncbi:M28 family peptidase [Pelomyxa schiedti]|nr:M28 family peptidase [Pelomyxa schiedti]